MNVCIYEYIHLQIGVYTHSLMRAQTHKIDAYIHVCKKVQCVKMRRKKQVLQRLRLVGTLMSFLAPESPQLSVHAVRLFVCIWLCVYVWYECNQKGLIQMNREAPDCESPRSSPCASISMCIVGWQHTGSTLCNIQVVFSCSSNTWYSLALVTQSLAVVIHSLKSTRPQL